MQIVAKVEAELSNMPNPRTPPMTANTEHDALVERLRRTRETPAMIGATIGNGGRRASIIAGVVAFVNPDGPEAAATITTLAAENAELRAALARVRASIDFAPARPARDVDADIITTAKGGASLRQIAKMHGVGVGRVRGAIARAALNPKDQPHDQQ